MSTKRFCDRCDTHINRQVYGKLEMNQTHEQEAMLDLGKSFDGSEILSKEADLCANCYKDLEKWIEE